MSMCGIVCYFGQYDGVARVLEALHLLEYRAPDSSGIAVLGENGTIRLRRSVGSPKQLVAKMAEEPLFASRLRLEDGVAALLSRQGLDLQPKQLRDCSRSGGVKIENLYEGSGLNIGLGDRGELGFQRLAGQKLRLSTRVTSVLETTGAESSPDFDRDAVRHAFRLVGAHVASRARNDPDWREALDRSLMERAPVGAYTSWMEAWEDELSLNTPGLAFSVAVRLYQQTEPGLIPYLNESDWERVGGLTARNMPQIVMGHGRWAMVGAVTEANAHPFTDREGTRMVCENGSHNASLLLEVRQDQETWWHERGVPLDEPVHRSENTTEVVAYEWERAYHQLCAGELGRDQSDFLHSLAGEQIADPEEQALRLALWRLRSGNAHACTFYSQRAPGKLYVSSHRKPIAIAMRRREFEDGSIRREIMVASDVNAALMLWPGAQVESAAQRIQDLRSAVDAGEEGEERANREIEAYLDTFSVEVIFLDADLFGGEELFACISNQIQAGEVIPVIQVSRYDGAPVPVTPQLMRLDPSMAGKRGYDSYTESHIAEIPQVLKSIIRAYTEKGRVRLDSVWEDEALLSPGLKVGHLEDKFGPRLERLHRLLLIGEGSSWRDAHAAAPLIRYTLPDVIVNIYRPVEVLNLGEAIDPGGDLALEISWSGTTDSLLKVDSWLAEMGVTRLGITGRPQSDLGRHTAGSGGTLDVRSGVEVSVATVKGYHAILTTLDLLALQMAQMRAAESQPEELARLVDELTLIVPGHVNTKLNDGEERRRIREVAERCSRFNKVAVVGDSPADVEAELKIEELAQIVALNLDFYATSLRALIEHSAYVDEDSKRSLFIIDATTPEGVREARPVINYLRDLGVFCIIHTTQHAHLPSWQAIPTAEVFVSPKVSPLLQPLIDVLFFFDLAVALAYARGLTPDEIDRPRNLAKSVTTTGAERRVEVEARREFHNVTLEEFYERRLSRKAWDSHAARPTRAAFRSTVALRAAISVIAEPLPELLSLDHPDHLIVVTDTEAIENAAHMAAGAWHELHEMDLIAYRLFLSDLPRVKEGTVMLRLIRAGTVLSVRDPQTIALPVDMSPLQWELLGSVYLIGLAIRLARKGGLDTEMWEAGLSQIPLLVSQMLTNRRLIHAIRATLKPYFNAGYDKLQVIGGGQDFASAASMARSFRDRGIMAEALYTDSAWHGPLATVGGGDAEHDALIVILATDPLFQAAALVDTQVYRTRHAPVILVVPEGNDELPSVRGVHPSAVLTVPSTPRAFTPVVNAALGSMLAREMARFREE